MMKKAATVGELLDNLEINRRLVLTVDDRATTVKERLLGRAQHRYPHQMMRIDRESVAPISAATADLLLSGIARCMDEIDLVLVSDYDKGVCKGDMFPRLIELARAAGVPVVADPVKDADYRRYDGCTCITPNRAEAGRALGMRITTPQEGLAAARKLLDFGVQSAIVTLDRDGMAWVDRNGRAQLFPARPRQVCDITGAGDMVLSVLGYMLAAGADPASAIEVANVAGGLEVERLGVVPLTRRDILDELAHSSPDGPEDPADGTTLAHARAAATGRQADRDDQRLLRPAAPRPRGLAARGPQAGRLPAGGRQQRPQRAGDQGSGPSRDRRAGPDRDAGRAGLRRLRRRLRRSKRGRAGRSRSARRAGQSRPVHDRTGRGPRVGAAPRRARRFGSHEGPLFDDRSDPAHSEHSVSQTHACRRRIIRAVLGNRISPRLH